MTDGNGKPAGRRSRPSEIAVWDPLVRLFHWSLAAGFTIAMVTGDDFAALHEAAGYAVAGLVGFRLVWGLIGSRHARFSDFVRKPSTVLAYLRDMLRFKAERHLGHNPAGGAMIVVLLALLTATAATGWLLTGDGVGRSEWIEELHEAVANGTLLLVTVHILGVVISGLAHGENLVKAMINGRKRAV